MNDHPVAPFEFHISRRARDRYRFDDALFALGGNVIFANFHATRVFAQKMNQQRDLVNYPEQAVKPGQINAMGLIDEILHHVAALYREQVRAEVMDAAMDQLARVIGDTPLAGALYRFVTEFPPLAVYRRDVDPDTYLAGETAGISNRAITLEEMLLLWLANVNPAFAPFLELFDDSDLKQEGTYPRIIAGLRAFFDTQPPFGPQRQNLVDMLRSPAIAVPHSLEGQLAYILEHWGYLLGKHLYRLLGGLDLIGEERKLVFLGPGPARPYEFAGLEQEPEGFSPDQEWMPRVVLLAKTVYVWLDQLSRQYARPIARLDEIPDEELDRLARQGFTGLWLIGLWERSPASQTIKQLTGNPEAVPSAYSLHDYVIATDLGGDAAYQDLKARAWQRGIRLASDMVPNHVGISSRWVIEHPDWFISLDHNPYPWYTFGGPDLSRDGRVDLYIEDHYYDRTDAAVVFKRHDRWTGSERFIYHGNDGTSMPWNDTAQLNYLDPAVREAVIQTILHVARQFPIIRFDAAMTLTKQHYQRLWFPEPGRGGAIPTRAEHGMSREEFNARMPNEFWREVVDRVAAEAPGTLLLAEAFWLLEGYFVRTLGMHRVYNSAFMNMLRDEDNAGYRTVIKNTIEFDPDILRRFVNFVNNPDERTAVDQFGKEDKYFGVCTMMVTMPGLPMFGHGQIEGFSERYGMEYQRAYWDEQPDRLLVERHEREIFPLLHRRSLFAGVEGFLLYDFFDPDGAVNEDVFAYSNQMRDERALVIYHNRYAAARGWIRTSAAYSARREPHGERKLVQRTLFEGLGLEAAENQFCVFRDHITGLEYIRDSEDLRDRGLYVELDAYKCHVFLDFRSVWDDERHHYRALADYLNGRGVPSVDEALREIAFQPVLHRFEELVNAGLLTRLFAVRVRQANEQPDAAVLDEVELIAARLLGEIKRFAEGAGDETAVARRIRLDLEALLSLPVLAGRLGTARTPDIDQAAGQVGAVLADDASRWATVLAWLFVRRLGEAVSPDDAEALSRSWMDEWLLGRIVGRVMRDLGSDVASAARAVTLVKLLITHGSCLRAPDADQTYLVLESLLRDGDVRAFLLVNRYHEVLWYSKEAFEDLFGWLLVAAAVDAVADRDATPARVADSIVRSCTAVRELEQAGRQSRYQVATLLNAARR